VPVPLVTGEADAELLSVARWVDLQVRCCRAGEGGTGRAERGVAKARGEAVGIAGLRLGVPMEREMVMRTGNRIVAGTRIATKADSISIVAQG
jgi:hypothetical protein